MRFRVGLRTVTAGPGEVVLVEPGVAHSFANAGEEEARLRVEVRPALAMEEMFADVIALAQAGRMNSRGMPRNPLDLALLARTYDQEAHAPLLGLRLQRALLAPLVALARRRERRRDARTTEGAASRLRLDRLARRLRSAAERRACGHDAVAALALGFVEDLVGPLHQRLRPRAGPPPPLPRSR